MRAKKVSELLYLDTLRPFSLSRLHIGCNISEYPNRLPFHQWNTTFCNYGIYLCKYQTYISYQNFDNIIISSPEWNSGWVYSILFCPSSVCPQLLKRLLLWNQLVKFDETSQKWSWGGLLQNLLKNFIPNAERKIFKNLLVRKYKG